MENQAVTKKVLIILGMVVALMIPLSMVEYQIGDRKKYENDAQQVIAKSWGESVIIRSSQIWQDGIAYYPIESDTNIEVETKEKSRGAFRVPVYVATVKAKVKFGAIPESLKDKKPPKITYLLFQVYPASNIQNFKIKQVPSGKEVKGQLASDGIRLPLSGVSSKSFFNSEFEFEVVVRGTNKIKYDYYSDTEKVKISGNWSKPQFAEELLPTDSKVTDKGFEATWLLNSMLPWQGKDQEQKEKTIGVSFLWMGTDYVMIDKAVKYGILFIILTFLLVFIVEVLSKAKIHPLQYGLIGLSITIFYLLVLALAEVVGFHWAYLISTTAVTGLIVFYVHGFMKQGKFVRMMLFEQIILSGFFYLLLSLEAKALLIGTIGLFFALALFMSITRKFDWYSGTQK